ncbi:response regulator transcription factor [Diaphorobacter ruginosibacter]|uniref:Response regulator transcription factor n=1 Tax=Diaphorobacter ruginosibacter TaxID=1715720 RepID=A0A7G9RMD7_9BURK|nr:response regulator transcription factor [Diaphorobacter ruginosibacter]QNN56762.1 response regulator transcription factor [Diaphorobacter ruginosibacter]
MSSSTSSSTVPYALVIDDHPMVAHGMGLMLGLVPGLRHVELAHTASDGLKTIALRGAPLVVVMDFWLAEGSSSRFVSDILALAPDTRLLMVSGDSHPALPAKVRATGAHGLLHKSCPPEPFREAVAALLAGAAWVEHASAPTGHGDRSASTPQRMSGADLGLTQRQGQVLDLVLRGKSNRAIAEALSLSEYTVKEHVTGILQKTGCTNRVELITQMQGVDLHPPSA